MFKLVQMIKTSSQKQISFLIQYYSLYPRSYSAIIRTIPFKASWNYCKYWIKIPFWKMNPLEDFVHSVILDKIWICFPELHSGQNLQVDTFSSMESGSNICSFLEIAENKSKLDLRPEMNCFGIHQSSWTRKILLILNKIPWWIHFPKGFLTPLFEGEMKHKF